MEGIEALGTFQIIDLARIEPNRINPRGPNVRENDVHRQNLKESIAQFGILVPLVVRPMHGGGYELIDGERRYWIAKERKIKQVPAYVVNGGLSSKEVLQRMFQIHMNRDQWDPVQQCKACEELYSESSARLGDNVDAVIDEFVRFTGDDRRTVRNRIQFLRWPSDVKQEIYDDPEKHKSYWYVVEIEDKIVEPAQRNYPEYFQRVDVNEVRRFLYRKWEASMVRAGVEVRQAAIIVRSELKGAQRKKALTIFDKLVKNVDVSYEDAFQQFAREFPDLAGPKLPKPRSLINSVTYVADVLAEYQPEYFEAYGKRNGRMRGEMVEAVRSLLDAAQGFLKRMRV
jgi:ParB/RepB/Spo0J family partition protein